MSLLEIFGNVFTLACVFLAAKNSPWSWPTGIIGCLFYGVMFFNVKLYADVTLQVFFVLTSVAGWMKWLDKSQRDQALPITTTKGTSLLIYIISAAISALGYGALLHYFTDASFPFIDSVLLTFSIAAQFLLVNRKLENWLFWLLVNTISVPLYATKNLPLTSFVYLLFWFNALYGYKTWRKKVYV